MYSDNPYEFRCDVWRPIKSAGEPPLSSLQRARWPPGTPAKVRRFQSLLPFAGEISLRRQSQTVCASVKGTRFAGAFEECWRSNFSRMKNVRCWHKRKNIYEIRTCRSLDSLLRAELLCVNVMRKRKRSNAGKNCLNIFSELHVHRSHIDTVTILCGGYYMRRNSSNSKRQTRAKSTSEKSNSLANRTSRLGNGTKVISHPCPGTNNIRSRINIFHRRRYYSICV